jgi:hypothetical protein
MGAWIRYPGRIRGPLPGADAAVRIVRLQEWHPARRPTWFLTFVVCPNPHYDLNLRPFTGRDAPVMTFLEAEPEVLRMRNDIAGFVRSWLPLLRPGQPQLSDRRHRAAPAASIVRCTLPSGCNASFATVRAYWCVTASCAHRRSSAAISDVLGRAVEAWRLATGAAGCGGLRTVVPRGPGGQASLRRPSSGKLARCFPNSIWRAIAASKSLAHSASPRSSSTGGGYACLPTRVPANTVCVRAG